MSRASYFMSRIAIFVALPFVARLESHFSVATRPSFKASQAARSVKFINEVREPWHFISLSSGDITYNERCLDESASLLPWRSCLWVSIRTKSTGRRFRSVGKLPLVLLSRNHFEQALYLAFSILHLALNERASESLRKLRLFELSSLWSILQSYIHKGAAELRRWYASKAYRSAHEAMRAIIDPGQGLLLQNHLNPFLD